MELSEGRIFSFIFDIVCPQSYKIKANKTRAKYFQLIKNQNDKSDIFQLKRCNFCDKRFNLQKIREVVSEHASGETLGFLGRFHPRERLFRLSQPRHLPAGPYPAHLSTDVGSAKAKFMVSRKRLLVIEAEDFRIFGYYG